MSLHPFSATRTYLFDGGCVTYHFAFAQGAPPTLLFGADVALSFVSRAGLVDFVRRTDGLELCGKGARCPG
jgi:hypothetical protein